jgi:glyoxylase-like metal-dependent hydrolase (beta-lactamase superfamily II)
VILKEIVPGVHSIQLGVSNAYLIEGYDLTLVDTGSPGSGAEIMRAVQMLGRSPREIAHILVTHCHPDHAGSLAEIKRVTGAAAYMHPISAAVVRGEEAGRPLEPAPGLLNRFLTRFFIRRPPWRIPWAFVEHEVLDGDELDCTGKCITAVHTPGHCCGQLGFLYHYKPANGALLFVADAASNIRKLGMSIAYEDLKCGVRSLARLAELRFDVACFGHGGPIIGSASDRFREKWGATDGLPTCD